MSLPSAKTLSRIIDDILDNIELLFEQVICLCHAFGLIGQERMYIDGTKTKANASKHKAMSYEYLCKK
jgi:transposase